MMIIDANDLLLHEGHRITVKLEGPEQTDIFLWCEDDDEILAEDHADA